MKMIDSRQRITDNDDVKDGGDIETNEISRNGLGSSASCVFIEDMLL
ncbi:MAG: hypothetical protein IKR48_04760 [Kiritimatiellae bacterium]|nr:hypothetical protein [Kiritimatiellia bacterium]